MISIIQAYKVSRMDGNLPTYSKIDDKYTSIVNNTHSSRMDGILESWLHNTIPSSTVGTFLDRGIVRSEIYDTWSRGTLNDSELPWTGTSTFSSGTLISFRLPGSYELEWVPEGSTDDSGNEATFVSGYHIVGTTGMYFGNLTISGV